MPSPEHIENAKRALGVGVHGKAPKAPSIASQNDADPRQDVPLANPFDGFGDPRSDDAGEQETTARPEPPPHDTIPPEADRTAAESDFPGDKPLPNSDKPDAGASQENPQGAERQARATKFKLIWLGDIQIGDEPACLIEGMLPAGPSFGVTHGPPKSLKSFLLMHVCFHISTSRPCFGREVLAGATAYVTSEGIQGVNRRLVALRKAYEVEKKFTPMALVPVMPNLGMGIDDREILKKLIAEAIAPLGIPLRMIVIDTLRRAIPGKSENDQKDMSVFVDNCEDLARTFQCHVNAVHHSPRSDDNRGSGSNSIDGAADVMWGVVRSESGTSTVEVVRFKDGREGDTVEYDLQPIDVGIDRRGVTLTSCYLNVLKEPADEAAPHRRRPQERIPGQAQKALEALQNALAGDQAITMLPGSRRAVARAAWVGELTRCRMIDPAAKPDSARNMINRWLRELMAGHRVACQEDLIWLL